MFPNADYMEHVGDFFDAYAIKNPKFHKNVKPDVYVASDDPSAFTDLEQK